MSISHLVHTLRAYAPVIVLSTAAVGLVYVVAAVMLYVFAPAQRITTQPFRIDFEGATEGKYPNGLKFTSSDIVSTPILLKVFQVNGLDRFTSFPSFSRAVFVLESNPEYERLAADYQSRINDPKTSAIDRERLLREWQSKAGAVAKNDYAIHWLRTRETMNVPETAVKKALLDILQEWSRFVVNDQHVLRYRLTVLSPQMISTADGDGEPLIAIQVLRSQIYKVLQNLDDLHAVPGSELVRSADGMSLAEIRLRLEEIIRFRIEPLAARVSSGGVIQNRAGTMRFLESQLTYDQRLLKATQDNAESVRQSIALYSLEQRGFAPESTAPASSATSPSKDVRPAPSQRSDTVMPQISDSFIDRVVTLSSLSMDIGYRQKVADEYRQLAQSAVPMQQSVTYDQEVLNLVAHAPAGSAADAAPVRAEIGATQGEVKQLVGRIGEIYSSISRNLNPAKELYTTTAPPVARSERARSLSQLVLYGIALLAAALPLIIILCLIHARIVDEEATEAYVAAHEAEAV